MSLHCDDKLPASISRFGDAIHSGTLSPVFCAFSTINDMDCRTEKKEHRLSSLITTTNTDTAIEWTESPMKNIPSTANYGFFMSRAWQTTTTATVTPIVCACQITLGAVETVQMFTYRQYSHEHCSASIAGLRRLAREYHDNRHLTTWVGKGVSQLRQASWI